MIREIRTSIYANIIAIMRILTKIKNDERKNIKKFVIIFNKSKLTYNYLLIFVQCYFNIKNFLYYNVVKYYQEVESHALNIYENHKLVVSIVTKLTIRKHNKQ